MLNKHNPLIYEDTLFRNFQESGTISDKINIMMKWRYTTSNLEIQILAGELPLTGARLRGMAGELNPIRLESGTASSSIYYK